MLQESQMDVLNCPQVVDVENHRDIWGKIIIGTSVKISSTRFETAKRLFQDGLELKDDAMLKASGQLLGLI